MSDKKRALKALDALGMYLPVDLSELDTLRTYIQSTSEGGWRDIESAEKSWAPILAMGWTEDGQPVPIVVHWRDGMFREYSTGQAAYTVRYWQPLPPPPQTGLTTKEGALK